MSIVKYLNFESISGPHPVESKSWQSLAILLSRNFLSDICTS